MGADKQRCCCQEYGPSLMGVGDPDFANALAMFSPAGAFMLSGGGFSCLINPETVRTLPQQYRNAIYMT